MLMQQGPYGCDVCIIDDSALPWRGLLDVPLMGNREAVIQHILNFSMIDLSGWGVLCV